MHGISCEAVIREYIQLLERFLRACKDYDDLSMDDRERPIYIHDYN